MISDQFVFGHKQASIKLQSGRVPSGSYTNLVGSLALHIHNELDIESRKQEANKNGE